ncbi:rRNA maturation RNase YbeY [Bacillus suaedae]|uniref:Endoribonuclease YbeY n=1 Tax=Halalkalibacter suaedae TaxID=2822140 RepID=A0A941AN63_9BACI|nr:rRNA maturation RNase YbeY [Bacillus suaedae]MBP3951295.1 rRNA maturation RNase YbeY [Bacillus suaedae]
MNVTVDLNDETDMINEHHQKLVNDVVNKTLEFEQVKGEIEVSVTFVSEERIQALNAEYRGKDQPTDVISFALNDEVEGELVILDDVPNMLGDIIISVSHIKQQAEEYGHSFERELGFLTVHGMLHLLGYDHMTDAEEKDMFSRQENILADYGLTR